MKRILCTLLVIAISLTPICAFASSGGVITPQATGLGSCSMSIWVSGNTLQYDVDTYSTVTASEIGVSNLRLQRWNGLVWVNALSLGSSYVYNDSFFNTYGATTYTSGVKYRIAGTHYCIINGVTFTLNGNSGVVQP